MTGSLSIRGEVLPIGGVSAKIEAAIETGIKNVIVPISNVQDIVIDKEKLKNIKVIPVNTIYEVIEQALDWEGKESILHNIKKRSED
jgi:Lon-like ATP-dependent protease